MAKKKKGSKKTPEQRKAVRQAGWQQFKQGAKAKYYEIPRDSLANTITGGIKSFGSGDKKSMLKGAVEGSVAGNVVKRDIDATKDMIVGALKGIFNHPDWYKFNGALPTLAINTKRPFDPKSTYPIMDTLVEGGVSNLSLVSFKYNDVINNPAFQYAARELYQLLRLNLKSNLIESQTDIEYYLAQAIELTVRIRSLEKRYGLIHAKDQEIPDLDIQFRQAPNTYSEIGLVDTKVTLDPTLPSYADALARFAELQNLASHITIPTYLNQYISWFVNGVFVDQTAPNKMYYTNVIRSFTKHTITQSGTGYSNFGFSRQVDSTIDLLDDTLPTLITDINNFLDTVGLVKADLEKVVDYTSVLVTLPEEYKFVFMEDVGYFNMIENAYGELPDDIFEELLRVDFMPNLPEDNRIGTLNGLNGALSSRGYTPLSPFEVLSQAILFHVQAGESIPMTQGILTTSTSTIENSQVAIGEYYWYQYTSNLSVDNTVAVTTDSSTTSNSGATNNPVTYSGDVTSISDFELTLDSNESTLLIASSPLDIKVLTVSGTTYRAALLSSYETVDVSAKLYIGADKEQADSDLGSKFSQPASIILTIGAYGANPSATIVLGTYSDTIYLAQYNTKNQVIEDWAVDLPSNNGLAIVGYNVTAQPLNIGSVSLDTSLLTDGQDYTATDALNAILSPTNVNLGYSYEFDATITNAASINYNQFAYNALVYFLHNLDHAIPIILNTDSSLTLVSGSTVTVSIQDQTTLIKETRVPTFINFNDLYNAQYWMYMGLFMNSFVTVNKPKRF